MICKKKITLSGCKYTAHFLYDNHDLEFSVYRRWGFALFVYIPTYLNCFGFKLHYHSLIQLVLFTIYPAILLIVYYSLRFVGHFIGVLPWDQLPRDQLPRGQLPRDQLPMRSTPTRSLPTRSTQCNIEIYQNFEFNELHTIRWACLLLLRCERFCS